MNKPIKFLLVILFLVLFKSVFAGFEISEIMYNPSGADTGHEWVEIENTGTTTDDLSKWYLFSDNTKHSIIAQTTALVPAGGYAVVAQDPTKFKIDWPSYTGLLFDSSWTGFNNKGETIALKDPKLVLTSQVTFSESQGGVGNGDSLQNINGAWVGSTPTPGAENKLTPKPAPKETMPPITNPNSTSSPSAKTSNRKYSYSKGTSDNSNVINLDNIDSQNKSDTMSPENIILSALGLVIITAIVTALLIRRKNKSVNALSASDIKIVE